MIEHLRHEFVEQAPDELDDGVLYVSIGFRTTLHRCCCGCGNVVVLPLRPSSWQLTYDGESVTMAPSVGNWSFPCRSHYWIRRGRIQWSGDWSNEDIADGRQRTLIERGAQKANTASATTAAPRSWIRRLFHRAGR